MDTAAHSVFSSRSPAVTNPNLAMNNALMNTVLNNTVRSVFLVLLTLFAAGCWRDPPTYEDAQQIPPFIVVEKTQPPPWVFKRIQSGDTPTQFFTVVFFSEDLGDPVRAIVYVDTLPGDSTSTAASKARDQGAPGIILEIPPGSFDQERSVTFPVTDLTPGCHAVSVLLTHASNLITGDVDGAATIVDKDLVARMVWWLEVESEFGVEVSDCPTLGVEAFTP